LVEQSIEYFMFLQYADFLFSILHVLINYSTCFFYEEKQL